MKKSLLLITLLFSLLIIPQYAFAGLSESCFPAVTCPSGEDYYDGACNSHIETLADCPAVPIGYTKTFNCNSGCGQAISYVCGDRDVNIGTAACCSNGQVAIYDGSDWVCGDVSGKWEDMPLGGIHYGDSGVEQVAIGADKSIGILRIDNSTTKPTLYLDGGSSNRHIGFNSLGSFSIGEWDDVISSYTSRLFINSDGDVGIGNIGPDADLDVQGTLRVKLGESNSDKYFDIIPSSTSVALKAGWYGTSTAPDILFSIGGSTMLKVEGDNGNVGIGTTSPGAKLDVRGSAEIGALSNVSSGGNSFSAGAGNTASSTNTIALGTNTIANYSYAVAIGRGAESSEWGSVALGGYTKALGRFSTAMGYDSEASGSYSTAQGHATIASGPSSFALGSSSVASGNRSIAMGYNMTVSGEHSVGIGLGSGAATVSVDNAFVVHGGSVGIGATSPDTELHIHEPDNDQAVYMKFSSYDTGQGSNDGFYIGINGSDNKDAYLINKENTDMHFRTNNITRMTIDNIGRVGIADSTPEAMFHVRSTASESYAMRVMVGDATKLAVRNDGGVAIGSNPGTADIPNNGLYVYSDVKANRFVDRNNTNRSVDPAGTSYIEHLRVYGNTFASSIQTEGTSHDLSFPDSEQWQVAKKSPAGAYTTVFKVQADGDVYNMAGSRIHTSDRRMKKNIEDIEYGLDEIKELRPVSFTWKDRSDDEVSLGLIAQEIQPIIGSVVHDGAGEDESMLGISYEELIPVLIKAVQEQQEQIELLKDEINLLK